MNSTKITEEINQNSIDIHTKNPRLNTILGGLSGPCIKPVALANVFKLYKSIKIPILGIGGISSASDVIEFLLAGANFVQLGTINYKFPNLIDNLCIEVEKYLEANSVAHINELIGAQIIE